MKPPSSRTFNRTPIRLRGFDYTIAGSCFLTVCSNQMRPVFGRVVAGRAELSPLGLVVQSARTETPRHFPEAELDEFVVMPNHFHGLITIRNDKFRGSQENVEAFSAPIAGSISTIVRCFKAAVSRRARQAGLWGAGALWQRGFYEHVVRTGESLKEIRWYIQQNPVRWEQKDGQRARHVVPLRDKTQ